MMGSQTFCCTWVQILMSTFWLHKFCDLNLTERCLRRCKASLCGSTRWCHFISLWLLTAISGTMVWPGVWFLNYSKFRLILRYCLWQCFAQWIKWQILPGVAFPNLGVSLNRTSGVEKLLVWLDQFTESCIACIMIAFLLLFVSAV